ncbi:MAG: ATP-binding cassette domain-containing protein, partial [Rhodocyclaceae bacterium]|nr:ATP-binding cassette domain-containing protein [Rhodocyclaceae bacterium]
DPPALAGARHSRILVRLARGAVHSAPRYGQLRAEGRADLACAQGHPPGVSHAYGKHAAHSVVRELSLSLADGEIGCLLGASGCGKTTVLRLIAGFETPAQGGIRLRDVTVGALDSNLPLECHQCLPLLRQGLRARHPAAAGRRGA